MTHEKENAGFLSRMPLAGSLRDLAETWKVFHDYSRRPTCAEELGWPEWPQWF